MSIGIWQIAIVVILVVLLFGRGKISSLMGDVAKGIKSFKKGMASDVTDESEPKNISENNIASTWRSNLVGSDGKLMILFFFLFGILIFFNHYFS